MADAKKVSLKEREAKLLGKIQKAKQELSRLQNKRKTEIGAMAVKYGLDELSNSKLEKAFKKLSEEFGDDNK